MLGRIISLISCLMCAFPFFIIGILNKDSKQPISFWSGDTTLKSKVKNVAEYNEKMAALYKKCAIVFVVSGIVGLINPVVGAIMISLDCTLGIWLVYKNYKRILDLYS